MQKHKNLKTVTGGFDVKKCIRTLLVMATLLTVLCFSALAADGSGLKAFGVVREYAANTFDDVSADSWFAGSVKTVYDKGVMDGVGDGRFAPSDTVTWAQAVTIASRLHATYNALEIADADGAWYAKYLIYAKNAEILPSTVPEGAAFTQEMISRQELAGLFRNVLAQDDLPAINDMSIPDLEQVELEFRDAVADLYAAGILTGKNGGNFDPNGRTTRAEIATVITRLLSPGQRQSFDSRAAEIMEDQWGNLKNGGFAASHGDVTCYIIWEDAGEDARRYSIIARTDDGATSVAYETEKTLGKLAFSDDGLLYFVEGRNTLCTLDGRTGEAVPIYKSPVETEQYVFYDGEIYIFERYESAVNIHDWKYRIGHLQDGELRVLVDNMKYHYASHIEQLHCFNGRLYYVCSDESYVKSGYTFYVPRLWEVELETGKTRRIYDDEFYLGEAAFDGAAFWYLRYNDEFKLYEIVRGNLLMPEYSEVLVILPEEAKKQYVHMFNNGSRLFYQSSTAAKVWEISSDGEVSVIATMPTPHYEYCAIGKQGILRHAKQWIHVLDCEGISVCLPNGETVSYFEFLNFPYWKVGSDQFEMTNSNVFWGEHTAKESQVAFGAECAFYTPDGDLVIELMIANGCEAPVRLVEISAVLSDGSTEMSLLFEKLPDILGNGNLRLSLVIPAEALNVVFDLETMDRSIDLAYKVLD